MKKELERVFPIETKCNGCNGTEGKTSLYITETGTFFISFVCFTCAEETGNIYTYARFIEIALLQRLTAEVRK